jgi:hypothetical protein
MTYKPPEASPALAAAPALALAAGVDVAGLLVDLGYAATHSAPVLHALLRGATAPPNGATNGAWRLPPEACARLLLAVATTHRGLESDLSAVLVNAMLPAGVGPVPDDASDGRDLDGASALGGSGSSLYAT